MANTFPSEVIVVPTVFITIGYMTWVLVNAWQRSRRLRAMTDFHSKLLDKLGSVKDFGEFLQTEAGARFIVELGSEPATPGGPQERILRAAQLGAVLGCLGIGLLLLSFFSPMLIADVRHSLNAFGVVALSLGIGFIVSTFASFRLSTRMGLLGQRQSSPFVAPSH